MDDATITAGSIGRRVAVAALAGAMSGFLVGGVGGRVFMFVLAHLNPEETGVRTDDGFEMGQFTVSGTANLLVVTTVIGAVGGLGFLVLRGLRFGPAWFRFLSMPVGATIVVGSMLVHSDGVDFRLLEPVGLAVTMTLAVPLLYTVLLAGLADRRLDAVGTAGARMPAPVAWVLRAALAVLVVVTLVDLVSTIDDILHPFRFD